MKHIEIQDGISINIGCIEGIEKVDKKSCKIYTHHHIYLSTFPYSALLSMINQEDMIDKKQSSEEIMKTTMQKVDKVLNSAQHFVG